MKVENKQAELKPKKKKRKRRTGIMKYIYIFCFVFVGALFGLSYLIDSYSPKVDVSLGNPDETLTLSNAENEIEMKTIDERLKWIQMEDEMPSVAIRETLDADDRELQRKHEAQLEKEQESHKIADEVVLDVVQPKNNAPKPAMSDIVKQTADFRTAAKQAIIPSPIPSLTKVYLGAFSSLDEAIAIQQKVGNDFPAIMPFVKSKNGGYIVQIGSFSSKDVADTFITSVKEKGYEPKILADN